MSRLKQEAERKRLRNERMREESMEKLRQNLFLLEDYGSRHKIPKKVPMPTPLPVGLSPDRLKDHAYRDYMVRKHLELGQRSLNEATETDMNEFLHFHAKKIKDQIKATQSLIEHLGCRPKKKPRRLTFP